MRDALNSNPVVQMAVIGVLLLVGGILVLTQVGGGSDEPATDTSSGSLGSESGAAAAPAGATAGAIVTGPVTVAAFEPGEGMPARVSDAYKSGKAIVLLIYRRGAYEDRLVHQAVERLSSDSRLALFITPARGISRYSRITQGAGVSRVPALVVVRPRKLSHGTPTAHVEYGFRSLKSITQAVRDALYRGHHLPYHPG